MDDGGSSRRAFLAGAGAALAGLAVGCASDSDLPAKAVSTTAPGLGPTTTRHAAKLAGDPFGLGVASGDPLADAVVIWTRLAPDPAADDGLGAMPDDPVDVIWEVATDDRFALVVARGTATASPDHAHAVHVDVQGLDPASSYHYRFRVGEWTSVSGRSRTLPVGSPDRFRIAVANCQWLETGAYGAYRHITEDDDLDLVLHLGDYIYEFGSRGTNQVCTTLADYRLQYARYRADPRLAAAHARHPFVCTWDDHEVANNVMGDVLESSSDPAVARDRKTAAYRAWWEHLPVRVAAPDGPELRVYQALTVGDLARVHVLDERQYAAVPPCRDEPSAAGDTGDCAARTAEDRTRLGDEQESWLDEGLATGGVAWNVLGNPVVLAGIDAGTGDDSTYYLDTWDGFPDARNRLIARLAEADNPVVLTGDYHAGMALDVNERPFEDTPVVCTELMAPPISSPLFAADVSARTPQLRQQINAHGYLAVTIEPERLTADFQVLDDVADPRSAIGTAATWEVTPGQPRAVKR
jgi:phosphodiesterase/alkaline phosphatase D-like protein